MRVDAAARTTRSARWLAASLAVLLAAGCVAVVRHEDPGTIPAPEAAWPPGLHWARNSAEHRAIFLQLYRLAGERLEELAAGRAAGSWAVIADADETVLDNTQYQRELAERGEPYTERSWAVYVARRDAPPLPGAREFLERVHQLGGVTAIVTNRRESLCDDTRANFRRMDLRFDVMLCRPEEGSGDKNPRFRAVATGTVTPELPPLEVLLFLGDNIGDFPELDQGVRFAGPVAFGPFGDRYFLFPNPLYGSWEENPQE